MAALKERAGQREHEWRKYALPVVYLVDFVLHELDQMRDLAPMEIFSADALNAFLSYSAKSITAYERGVNLQSIGSPKVARPPNVGKLLKSLFEAWMALGWVSVSRNQETDEVVIVAAMSR